MLKYHNISSDQIIVNARANSTWKERRVIWKWVYDCPLNVCFGARVNDVSDYQGGEKKFASPLTKHPWPHTNFRATKM